MSGRLVRRKKLESGIHFWNLCYRSESEGGKERAGECRRTVKNFMAIVKCKEKDFRLRRGRKVKREKRGVFRVPKTWQSKGVGRTQKTKKTKKGREDRVYS